MSIWNQAKPQLRDLVAYEPGKPVEDVARELNLEPADIVKLASNENPLGPSPMAVAAMTEAVAKAHFYPDGGGYHLRNAIGAANGLDRSHVILGNGSNEIIEFVGHAFLNPGDAVVVAEHAFVVYKLMATLFGATAIEVPDPGFTHDLDAMAAAVTGRVREVFIANPNNPTGTMVEGEAVRRFVERVPDDVIVVLDEAYHEFLDNPPDTVALIRRHPNVIALRTFSKIQGLAGLRIGYGLADASLIDVLQKCRQPFNANAVAQAGALAGLRDTAHQAETKRVTDAGRAFLEDAFASRGVEYVPSSANFVLARVGDGDAVFQALMRRGVIVRAMRGYKLPEWIRVSVGTPEQNQRFLEEFDAVRGNV